MSTNETIVWRTSWLTLSLVAVVIALLYLTFAGGLAHMVEIWDTKESCSSSGRERTH